MTSLQDESRHIPRTRVDDVKSFSISAATLDNTFLQFLLISLPEGFGEVVMGFYLPD